MRLWETLRCLQNLGGGAVVGGLSTPGENRPLEASRVVRRTWVVLAVLKNISGEACGTPAGSGEVFGGQTRFRTTKLFPGAPKNISVPPKTALGAPDASSRLTSGIWGHQGPRFMPGSLCPGAGWHLLKFLPEQEFSRTRAATSQDPI